jgi:hypothetical protein
MTQPPTTSSRIRHPKTVTWVLKIKAMRAFAVILFACAMLCGIGIAQTKPAPVPNLEDTLLWMNHFSYDHGFLGDDRGIRVSNQFLSKGCNASIEVAFPRARTTKRNIRKRTEDVKLAELNPKVTLQTNEKAQTVEVYFEGAGGQMKIHEFMEYGDGARLEAWASSETLYFDMRGSAIRFARAFSRAITLCKEISPI